MLLTHKTEIFPSKAQIKQIEINFGLRRFFFNRTITELKRRYKDLSKNKSLIKTKEVMSYRKDIFRTKYTELTGYTSAHVLDTAMEDVVKALDSLWKKGRNIKLRKKKNSNTFRICRSGTKSDGSSTSFDYRDKYIRLPKIGFLKMAESLRWVYKPGTIRSATVKKIAGRYFISIDCEIDDLPKLPNRNRHIGVDWGLSTYLTCFDGENIFEADFDNSKLKKLDYRISKLQKSLSRKDRFSKNWEKAKIKLQQCYLNFNNYRLDYIKRLVKEINDNFDTVTLEDLSMSFVAKNHKLAHRAKQKPFYLLKSNLINKFKQYGKNVYQVPSDYPSTQTCNSCGFIKTGHLKMKLGQKKYICDSCGYEDDRDHNAAKNLYSYKNLTIATIDE